MHACIYYIYVCRGFRPKTSSFRLSEPPPSSSSLVKHLRQRWCVSNACAKERESERDARRSSAGMHSV